MRRPLIAELLCPYCGSGFELKHAVERGDRVRFGLLECRCFTFPIVEGILLLSLAKGYGGAEEALQPYTPLQTAAVHYIQRDHADDLSEWIREHIPLAHSLLVDRSQTYLEWCSKLALALDRQVAKHLYDYGRFKVIGDTTGILGRVATNVRLASRQPNRRHELEQLLQFYPSRFFSGYAQSTMLQLGWMPVRGRVLSLCCGHGMFENLLNVDGRAEEVVSVDGQFLNLLATQRFVNPRGLYICQDLQLGLPFPDGAFEAVFSSTCLPEIPAQRALVREAIRVTAAGGWTWFDGVWAAELGGQRIDARRHYRFAQNYFARLTGYVDFFAECAGGRTAAMMPLREASSYADAAPHWLEQPDQIRSALDASAEKMLSALFIDRSQFGGFLSAPRRDWLNAGLLSPSPAYDARAHEGTFHLSRRDGFGRLPSTYAPAGFEGYPESVDIPQRATADRAQLLNLYSRGVVSVLPDAFDRDSAPFMRDAERDRAS